MRTTSRAVAHSLGGRFADNPIWFLKRVITVHPLGGAPMGRQSGEGVVDRILAADPATTALVTVNEAALGGLYRGLATHGRRIPVDFSVTGIAASRWASAVTPQLTAADVPAAEMGRIAVELLLELLHTPDAPPRHVLLTPPVSLRASAGSAPVTGP